VNYDYELHVSETKSPPPPFCDRDRLRTVNCSAGGLLSVELQVMTLVTTIGPNVA